MRNLVEDTSIPRRTFLHGVGAALALPFLEVMMPRRVLAGAGSPAVPCRMAVLYVPNGIHMRDWTPGKEGSDFDLPRTLELVKPFKDQLLVLSGLTQDKARPNGDGPGDHARAAAAFLTGTQPFKTHGANIKVGVSFDQVAAAVAGKQTKFPSLELGCDRGQQSGNCDSGYSCAYSSNISWKTESMPMAKETNPRLVFERLFTGGTEAEIAEGQARREGYRKSLLDLVREDARSLERRLGSTDRRKLEEYLTAVREVEQRISRTGSEPVDMDGFEKPEGIPAEYGEHIRILCDLIALAFQTDTTRIVTFMLANEGSNRSYRFIDVPEGHHNLSHHGGDKEKHAKIAKINRFHLQYYAHLLQKLESVEEGDGRLLDNSMILYGSCISDGNRHNHDELPILLAGKGCGTIRTGRHVRHPRNTPLNNLYLSMLDRMGAPTDSLGDSTGRLQDLG